MTYNDDEEYIDINYDIYSVGMDIDNTNTEMILINDSPISSPISRTRHVSIVANIHRANNNQNNQPNNRQLLFHLLITNVNQKSIFYLLSLTISVIILIKFKKQLYK